MPYWERVHPKGNDQKQKTNDVHVARVEQRKNHHPNAKMLDYIIFRNKIPYRHLSKNKHHEFRESAYLAYIKFNGYHDRPERAGCEADMHSS